MNAHEYLSDDGQAMLLLCSALALPPAAKETGLSPLKLSEWNQLERKIRESSLKHPAALQGRSAEELAKALALPDDEAEDITRRLECAGSFEWREQPKEGSARARVRLPSVPKSMKTIDNLDAYGYSCLPFNSISIFLSVFSPLFICPCT